MIFLPKRRKITEINLRLCFPEMADADLLRLARAHYEAIGIGAFEACFGWWVSPERLPPFQIHGAAHLEEASAKGKGVLLLTAHFTTLEICGRVLCDHFRLGALFRNPDNPVIAFQMRRARTKGMSTIIPMDDLRGLIRALRHGETIWYAPDQGKRTKFSSVLPFFGVPALTNTATSRIAAMTGSAVVPYFAERDPNGVYHLRFQPALEGFPSNDPEADALRITGLIEEAVRRAPEQYFWIHRRFKRRGKNLPNVYRR